MSNKLICFDLDNTLAPYNGPIDVDVINELKLIQAMGNRLMIISGKPSSYIAGIIRQTGLREVAISGGNGEVFYNTHVFPPEIVLEPDITKGQIKLLTNIKDSVKRSYNEAVWFQPNGYQLTIFHYENPLLKQELESLIKEFIENSEEYESMVFYSHKDCIDILPNHMTKGSMVVKAANFFNIELKNVISIGDGDNDVSMFEITGESIGINTRTDIKVNYNVNSIQSAICIIKELL